MSTDDLQRSALPEGVPPSSPEDKAFQNLVIRVKNGETDAIAELIDRYESEVAMIARVRLGAPLRPYLDSVDIMQSVHRSILVGLRDGKHELRSPQALIGLAATMVRRKVARKWRREQRQVRLSGKQHNDDEPLAARLVSLAQSSPVSTEQAAMLHEHCQRLLSQLDDIDRKLIELRMAGYRTVEAAQQLGIDPDGARVRLSRARKRLREHPLLGDIV